MGVKTSREQDMIKPALQLLTLRGAFVWRNNSGAMSNVSDNGTRSFVRFGGAPGGSDILGLLPGGTFIAVELKRPGKKPTPKQQCFLDGVKRTGGVALVIHSIDELDRALASVLKEIRP